MNDQLPASAHAVACFDPILPQWNELPRPVRAAPACMIVGRPEVDRAERARMIAEAAYFRAEKRGFAPGAELDDWLAAEADIDRMAGSH